jgi:putative mRNA 3-end processing factor
VHKRFQLGWAGGVVLVSNGQLIYFDPNGPVAGRGTVFVSHAHGDHTRGLRGRGEVYLTHETAEILRSVKGVEEPLTSLSIGKVVRVGGLEVALHNAGHMLGSVQYAVYGQEFTVVYTGDINCRDMFTTKAARGIQCDTLILEATYGIPFYVFPDLFNVAADMVRWAMDELRVGRTPVFKVYSGGKAQEVMRIFNLFTDIPVVASREVAAVTEVYIKNGVRLRYLSSDSKEGQEALSSGEAVYITSNDGDCGGVKRPSIAMATGWAVRRLSFGKAFPISSHADFRQLIEYVKETGAKEVLTVHGFKEELAMYIEKKLGVRAYPLPSMGQRAISEY